MNVLERLKSKGLDMAEDAAASLASELFLMAEEDMDKLPLSFQPFVKMALPPLKVYVMGLIDKIDGEDDAGR